MRNSTRAKRWLLNDNVATHVVAAFLLVAFYYMAYRYPLQYGSTKTSPTYGDTPVVWQMGKYVLLSVLFIATLLLSMYKSNQRPQTLGRLPFTGWLLAIIGMFAFVRGIFLDNTNLIELGIVSVSVVGITLLSRQCALDLLALVRITFIYAVVSVAFEAIQVGLFLWVGRLPNLGYADNVSVRFGATLDDPNSWAILIALLLPVCWISLASQNRLRWVVCAALALTLPLTQSLTGMVVVPVVLALLGTIYHRKLILATIRAYLVRSVLILVSSLLLVLSGLWFLSTSKWFEAFLSSKRGSVNQRAGSVEGLVSMNFLEVLGFGEDKKFYESNYVSLLYGVGLPITLAYLFCGLLSIIVLYKAAQRVGSRRGAMLWGLCAFQASYLLGSISLQYSGIYPLNLIYVLTVAIATFTFTSRAKANADLIDA